jgi:hypothetical protein
MIDAPRAVGNPFRNITQSRQWDICDRERVEHATQHHRVADERLPRHA